jgi:hypothetical protein
VRLALFALAGQVAPGLTAPQPGNEVVLKDAVTAELDQTWRMARSAPEVESRIRDRFAACVTAHFPAPQAGKIAAAFADPARLKAMPVNELVSMTVRN